MKVPVYDWALDEWIRAKRKELGHDRAFYNSAAWRRLRAKVMEEFHGESQYELGLSPRRIVRAEVVHHVMHVEDFPGWALSEFALDGRGEIIRNLVPLSHEAHDIAHGRFGKAQRIKGDDIAIERW